MVDRGLPSLDPGRRGPRLGSLPIAGPCRTRIPGRDRRVGPFGTRGRPLASGTAAAGSRCPHPREGERGPDSTPRRLTGIDRKGSREQRRPGGPPGADHPWNRRRNHRGVSASAARSLDSGRRSDLGARSPSRRTPSGPAPRGRGRGGGARSAAGSSHAAGGPTRALRRGSGPHPSGSKGLLARPPNAMPSGSRLSRPVGADRPRSNAPDLQPSRKTVMPFRPRRHADV